MTQPIRKNPYRPAGTMAWLTRLAILFLVIVGCGVATLTFYVWWQSTGQGGRVVVEGGDPNLNPLERLYLQNYLATHSQQLQAPAGTTLDLVTFTIAPGQSADIIAANLAAQGLLGDSELFLNYLRYYGLDSQLAAGTFEVDPQQTIPELAIALTQAHAQEIELRFLEGWRLEEMANYLAVTTPAGITAADFRAITQRLVAYDLSRYDFLVNHPAGATLEGYLFPDTYRVPLDADAAFLVDLMLTNFGRQVSPTMRQAYGSNGLTIRQAVTLASIVERESPVPAERPLVASVFFNRLEAGMFLQADPTVQYAVGYDPTLDSWWKAPLFQSDLELESPYNTYLYGGLPPGPIANPGLASLQAIAAPAGTANLFFVADCQNPGYHLFSQSYEEHLANIAACP